MGKASPAWLIGLVIIGVVEIYLAWLFLGSASPAPTIAQILVLVAIPGVYLPLMVLTLKSRHGNGGG